MTGMPESHAWRRSPRSTAARRSGQPASSRRSSRQRSNDGCGHDRRSLNLGQGCGQRCRHTCVRRVMGCRVSVPCVRSRVLEPVPREAATLSGRFHAPPRYSMPTRWCLPRQPVARAARRRRIEVEADREALRPTAAWPPPPGPSPSPGSRFLAKRSGGPGRSSASAARRFDCWLAGRQRPRVGTTSFSCQREVVPCILTKL